MSSHRKRLCLIHAYPNDYLVERLDTAGFDVCLFGPRGLQGRSRAASVVPVDLADATNVIELIAMEHEQRPFDVVPPLYEGATPVVSMVAERCGLAGNPTAAAEASRNKHVASALWARAGLPVPRTFAIHELSDAAVAVRRHVGYPAVLKLSDSMNSQGVGLVRNEGELESCLARFGRLLNRPKDVDAQVDRNRIAYGRADVALIAQEFCGGPEVGVDLLHRGGEWVVTGVFEKAPAMGPWFAESMSICPTSLGAQAEEELGRLAAQAVMALGATVGAAHVEIRYAEGGPRLLEAGLRPGGGYTMQAVEVLHGICPAVELSRILLGGPLPAVGRPAGAVLYGGIVYSSSGTLKSVEGAELLKRMPEVRTHAILHAPGDTVVALPESAQPHYAYYLLSGEDREALIRAHREIQTTIRVEIEPRSP